MPLLDRLRALLDLDFEIDLTRDPFSPIADDLYLGQRPTPEHLPLLNQAGITHVVSCLEAHERPRVAFLEDHAETLFLPLADRIHEDIASTIPTVQAFLQAAPQGAKTLLHCEAGVSRSATLAIAVLMHRTPQPFFDAYLAVRQKRHEVLPNIGFATQLQHLEHTLLSNPPRRPSSLARYLKEICATPVDLDTLDQTLHHQDHDALAALQALFGEDLPRVIQGLRL